MFTKSVMTPRVFSDLPEPCGVHGERARWVAVAAVLDPDMFGSDPDIIIWAGSGYGWVGSGYIWAGSIYV